MGATGFNRARREQAKKVEKGGKYKDGKRTETTDETNAFRASGKTAEELFAEARIIQLKFKTGGWILGGFLGFIFWISVVSITTI